MTWNIRYTIPFVTIDGQHLTVNIWQADYGGSAKQLTPAAEPFTTSEGTATDLYTPVRTQSGYIRFIVEDATTDIAASLLAASATAHPVTLTAADGTILWAGFLKGAQYTQPWQSYPYQQELPVCSVMSTMDGVNFTQDNGFTSIQSLTALISTYLPFDLTTIVPSVIDATLQVPNTNWQTFLTEQERKDKNTTAIYSVSSVKAVMEDFCRYFGVSLHENGTALVFYAHDAQYTGATAHDLTAQQIRSASNSASYTTAYRYVKGTFSANGDKAGGSPIELPSKFSDAFAIDASYLSYIVYKGNDFFLPYVDGKQQPIKLEKTFGSEYYPIGSNFGQLVSAAETNIDKYGNEDTSDKNNRSWGSENDLKVSGYSTSWKDSLLLRIKKGADVTTLMKVTSTHPFYIPAGGSVFELYLTAENDMPDNEYGEKYFKRTIELGGLRWDDSWHGNNDKPFIRSIHAKVKFGKYYLKSTIKQDKAAKTDYCTYEWSDTEQVCILWLVNNKLQFYNATVMGPGGWINFASTQNKAFTSLKGINLPVPEDMRGTYADMSVEFLSEVINDHAFMFFDKEAWLHYEGSGRYPGSKPEDYGLTPFCCNYIQFLVQDFTAKIMFPASTTDQVTGGYGSNTYLASNDNNQPDGTEFSVPITTQRGSQVGAGVAMDADHNYVTTFYDRLGVTRRAAIVDKPRQVLSITMAGQFSPVDTFTWNGRTYAILAQDIKWRMNQNTVRMLDITNPGTSFGNTEGIIEGSSGATSGGSSSGGNSSTATGGSSSGASANAAHADYAEEAGHATSSATLDNDSPVWTRVKTFIASAVTTLTDTVKGMFLRKDQDDTTEHKLTMGEAEVNGNATVEGSNTTKGNATVGGDLDVGGSAAVHGDLAIGPDGTYSITKEGVAKLAGAMADYLKSKDFSAGTGKGFDGTGYGITKDPATGKYTLEVDNLIARMKMVVAQLEVHEMSFIGGTVVMSACGNRMLFVEPLDAEGNIITDATTPDRYRCYFLATDGDLSVSNKWTVGQLARCQTNNITAAGDYTNYENRDYWRLVVDVSSAPVEKDGKTCHWIDLSNSTSGSISLTDASGTVHVVTIGGVSATMNSAPRENDCIIGMGHQWDDHRQDVAIVSASGWVLYKGIDHYDLPKANIINKFGIDEVIITSDHYSLRPYAQPDDVQTALCYRGPYADGNWYGRGDLVSHIRRMWLCVVKLGDKITGQAPSDGSPYWVAYSDKAADVLSVTRSGNGLVRLDAPDVITLAIRDMYGNDVTADYAITVSRDSGNATADSQWGKTNGTLAKPWKLTIRPADLTEAALSGSIPFTISCRHTTDPANNPDITRTISETLDSTRQLRIAFQSDKGSFVLASAVNVKLTGRILYGDDDYTARFLADPRTEWTWSRDSGNAEADKGWKPKAGETPNILSIEHHYKDPYTRADCGPQWRERLQVSFTLTAKVYIDATDAASATTITATVKIG